MSKVGRALPSSNNRATSIVDATPLIDTPVEQIQGQVPQVEQGIPSSVMEDIPLSAYEDIPQGEGLGNLDLEAPSITEGASTAQQETPAFVKQINETLAADENLRDRTKVRFGNFQAVDAQGNPLTEQQQASFLTKEEKIQGERLPVLGAYDYRAPTTINEAQNKKFPDGPLRQLQEFSILTYSNLSKYGVNQATTKGQNISNPEVPSSLTAMAYLAEQAQVNEVDFLNATIEETMAVGREIVRTPVELKADEESGIETDLNDIDFFDAEDIDDAIFSTGKELDNEVDRYQSPMALEDFKRRTGKNVIKNISNKKRDNGIPTNFPMKSLNPSAIGDIILQSLIATGFAKVITDSNTGQDFVVLDEYGRKIQRQSWYITKRNDSNIKGGSTYTPAPFDENDKENTRKPIYHSFSRMSKLRPADYGRYKTKGSKQFTEMYWVRRANAIRGRSFYTTDAEHLGNVSLISALAFNSPYAESAKDLLNIGSKKYNKLMARGHTEESAAQDIRTETEVWVRSFSRYLSDLKDGTPATLIHRGDDYNGRSYGEDYYLGWQGNAAPRALTVNAKRKPIQLSQNNPIYTDLSNPDKAANIINNADKDLFGTTNGVKNYSLKNGFKPETIALFSLVWQQAILDPTIDPNTMTFKAQASNLTYTKLEEYARHGKVLEELREQINAVNPDGSINELGLLTALPLFNRDTLRADMDPDTKMPIGVKVNIPALQEGNPEYDRVRNTLDFIFSLKANHKSFGMILSALDDALRFSRARSSGRPYIPRAIGSMDMQMAGATILAYNLGNADVTSRSGLNWDVKATDEQKAAGINPLFNNRVAFTNELNELVKDPYTIERIFKWHKNDFHINDLADVWKDTLDRLLKEPSAGNAFASSLAKKPTMTTRYGRPAMSHFDAMYDFLSSEKDKIVYGTNKTVYQTLEPYYNQIEEGNVIAAMADDLSRMVEQTLLRQNGRDADRFVKDYVSFIGLFGETPKYKGVYGNDWELGATTDVETELNSTVNTPEGIIEIRNVKREMDWGAAKRPKKIKVYNSKTGKVELEDYYPTNYSGVAGQALPQLGQSAESELMTALINVVNPDINDTEMTIDIYDNISSDMSGLAKYYAAASDNSKGNVVREVLNYDRFGAIVDGYRESLDRIKEKVKTHLKENKPFDIGARGDFASITYQGDNVYYAIEKMKKDGTWGTEKGKDTYWTQYNTNLLKCFEAMGYKNPEQRGDSEHVYVDPKQWLKAVVIPDRKGNLPTQPQPAFLALAYFYGINQAAEKIKPRKDGISFYQKEKQKLDALVSMSTEQNLFMAISKP